MTLRSKAGLKLKNPDLLLVSLPIFILALVVRIYHINLIGFSGDQALYAGQAAGLAGYKDYSRYFAPVSRGSTNFLIFQSIMAVAFSIFGVNDILARIVSVTFGVGTVIVVYLIAVTLFDKTVAALSSIILAMSGYHVILSRMALIDSTSVFFFFLCLFFFAKYLRFSNPKNVYLSLLFATLSTLTKVTSVVIFVVIAILLLARPSNKMTMPRIRRALTMLLPFAVLAGSYLLVNWGAATFGAEWQFTRVGNPIGDGAFSPPKSDYYIRQIIAYQGYVFPLLVVAATVYSSWKRGPGDHLILASAIIPLAFFEFYPLKGFQFILPSIVAMSLLVGRFLGNLLQARIYSPGKSFLQRVGLKRIIPFCAGLAFVVLVLSLTVESATIVQYDGFYFGARELAIWLRDNTPNDARFLTPLNGMANIIRYYSLKPAYPVLYLGQVNPDPNANIDQLVANGTVRYVIVDDYSTSILKPYSNHAYIVRLTLNQIIANYHGVLIYVHYVSVERTTSGDIRIPRAWVYRLNNS